MTKRIVGLELFNHFISADAEQRKKLFLGKMEDFPCSFNQGCSNLGVGGTQYNGFNISEPALKKDNCKYIKQNLEDIKEEDFEDKTWRDNLLTRIYVELDDHSTAVQINEKVRKFAGNQNLVALANAAFLFHLKKDDNEADKIIYILNKLKESPKFMELKVKAILQQAYEYRRFGGAKHLLCSVALFDFALPLQPKDERLWFMRAMVYRRCTHYGIYLEDSQNIDRVHFALEAAKELFRLGNEGEKSAIRSGAFIELAYLNHTDSIGKDDSSVSKNKTPLLDNDQWFSIIGRNDFKSLCFKALEAGKNNLTEKVLKIAGQLFRYFHTDEDLDRSRILLEAAVNKKPSTRAHHHLGLTYRKLAINYERQRGSETRVSFGQTSRNSNFNAYCANIDSTHQRYPPRNKNLNSYQTQWGSMQQRHPSRNSNNSRNYNIIEDRAQTFQNEKRASFTQLPKPPEDKRPQDLEQCLKYILKVPREKIKPFSVGNPFTKKAVEHLKQAVTVSHNQNIGAVYDLGMMYAQMSLFSESKKTCLQLIEVMCNRYTYVVNAYNLYGFLCALEAEKTDDKTKKMALIEESETMLIKAVRLASNLAASIPEFAMADTDLWEAFSAQKRNFLFKGSSRSKKILFQLCELVHDYRYIEELDNILSNDPSMWSDVEAMEKGLERYLKLEDLDGALLFLDMIPLHPKSGFKRENTLSVQTLLFKVAKRTLFRSLTQEPDDNSLKLPDLIWKQMIEKNINNGKNDRKWDVVIAQDLDDNSQSEPGTRSDEAAECLKDILTKIFGLHAVRLHEVGLPGEYTLNKDLETISMSSVVVFVLENDRCDSLLLVESLEKTLTLNENARASSGTGAHSEALNFHDLQEHLQVSTSESYNMGNAQAISRDDAVIRSPVSRTFEYLYSTTVKMYVKEREPNHIVTLCLGNMKPADCPAVLRGFPSMHFSDIDIDLLAKGLQINFDDNTVNFILDIFKTLSTKQ